jgi:hypothetical protein
MRRYKWHNVLTYGVKQNFIVNAAQILLMLNKQVLVIAVFAKDAPSWYIAPISLMLLDARDVTLTIHGKQSVTLV